MAGCLTPPDIKNCSGCDQSASGTVPSEEAAFYHMLLWKRRLSMRQDLVWMIQLFLSPSKSDQPHCFATVLIQLLVAWIIHHLTLSFTSITDSTVDCGGPPTRTGGHSQLPLPHFQLCRPAPAPARPEPSPVFHLLCTHGEGGHKDATVTWTYRSSRGHESQLE